ncbi:MAG: hypothetical protein JNL79_01265 [Myxococcales bacterium]|nr:hypothetical protein [Myxococcales bacterium]
MSQENTPKLEDWVESVAALEDEPDLLPTVGHFRGVRSDSPDLSGLAKVRLRVRERFLVLRSA